ncbi:thiamine pyrophosphate-binding protein [Rhodobacteraceae bacterium NNCM2]|nr:thiamine pyrophosphate-binding protein [Coraliihabitans acroporae]
MRTGGQILVDCLAAQGVTTAFGVPGESYLAVLDALYDSNIRFVICRQEGGAAFAAEAWGKLKGEPGICFVTRGPGATNASIGVHTAMQDSTPMILFVGQIAREARGREAFQEIDYTSMFRDVAKWVVEIDSADRVAEIVARAFATALGGRPGPVVVALPEDMLTDMAESRPAPAVAIPRAGVVAGAAAAAAELLNGAERPVILAGGGGWGGREGIAPLTEWAEKAAIPIAPTFRCQDLVDNNAPAYVGDAGVGMAPYIRKMLDEADVILALNHQFDEMLTDGYTLFDAPVPKQKIIHVHCSPAELGRVYQPTLAINAAPNEFALALSAEEAVGSNARRARLGDLRETFEASFNLPPQPGDVDMGIIMSHLREVLPGDAILTNGAGNFAIWPGRLFKYGPDHRMLGPQSGAMGAGIPAAVAAKVAYPDRVALCFAGDGDFQMTCQELGTAMQVGAQPIVLLLNNGTYGTIRMHQERDFPDRVSGTEIVNPDFVKLGEAYGMHAERVSETGQFEAAFQRALASPTGALIELMISVEAITPRRTLSDIRGTGVAA